MSNYPVIVPCVVFSLSIIVSSCLMEHCFYLPIARCQNPAREWFSDKEGGNYSIVFGLNMSSTHGLDRNAGWEESFTPPKGMYNPVLVAGEVVS